MKNLINVLIIAAVLFTNQAGAQDITVGPIRKQEIRLDQGFSGNSENLVNLYTGQVEFSISLFSIGQGSVGYDLRLFYSGKADAYDLKNDRFYNPRSVGVDWQLSEAYFFRDHNNTSTNADDKFYYSQNGSVSELLVTGHDESNKILTFNTEMVRAEVIRYYYSESEERWELLSTNGVKYLYGGYEGIAPDGYNKLSVNNSIVWSVAVGDHIIPSNVVYNGEGQRVQTQIASRWYLALITDHFSNEINFEYTPTEASFGGPDGCKITKNIDLTRISDQIGNAIALTYGSKDPAEFYNEENWQIGSVSYLQEFTPMNFLTSVQFIDWKQNEIAETQLEYTSNQVNGFSRRFLTEIEQLTFNKSELPSIQFNYNLTGTYFGKLATIKNHLGEVKTVNHTTVTLNLDPKFIYSMSYNFHVNINDVGNGLVYSKLDDTDAAGNPVQGGAKVFVEFLKWENNGWCEYKVETPYQVGLGIDDRMSGIIKYNHPSYGDILNYSVHSTENYIAVIKNDRHWDVNKEFILYSIPKSRDIYNQTPPLISNKFNFQVGNPNWGSNSANGGANGGYNNALQVVSGPDWVAVYGEQSGKLFLYKKTDSGFSQTDASQQTGWVQHSKSTNWLHNYVTVYKSRNGFMLYETNDGAPDKIYYYYLNLGGNWEQKCVQANTNINSSQDLNKELTDNSAFISDGGNAIHLFPGMDDNIIQLNTNVGLPKKSSINTFVRTEPMNVERTFLFNGINWISTNLCNHYSAVSFLIGGLYNPTYLQWFPFNGGLYKNSYNYSTNNFVLKIIEGTMSGGIFGPDYYVLDTYATDLFSNSQLPELNEYYEGYYLNNKPNIGTNGVLALLKNTSGNVDWNNGVNSVFEFIGKDGSAVEAIQNESISKLESGTFFNSDYIITTSTMLNIRKRIGNSYKNPPKVAVVSSISSNHGSGTYTSSFTYDVNKSGYDISTKSPLFNKTTVRHGTVNGYTNYFHFTGAYQDANVLGNNFGHNFQSFSSLLSGMMFRKQVYDNSNKLITEENRYYHVSEIPGYANKKLFYPMLKETHYKNGLLTSIEKYEHEIIENGKFVLRLSATENTDGNGNSTRKEIKYSYPEISQTLETNQINIPIQTTTKYNTNYTSSKASTFSLTNGYLVPNKTYQMINQSSSLPGFSAWTSGVPDINYWEEKSSIESYTTYGHPEVKKDLDNKFHSIQYRFPDFSPIASFSNASRLPAIQGAPHVGTDASYLGFESGSTQNQDIVNDYWGIYQTGINDLVTPGNTGKYALKISKKSTSTTYGPTRDFLPSNQYDKYMVSCWVKTDPGFTTGNSWLKIHSKQNTDSNNNTFPAGAYNAVSIPATNGQWQYLSAILDLNVVRGGNTDILRLRTFIENQNTVYPIYVDDIRFHPVNSVSNVTVLDSIYNHPIASIGNNDEITRYYYNEWNELIGTEGFDKTIRTFSTAYFSRKGSSSDSYSSSDPNSVLTASFTEGGIFYSFNYNNTDWTFSGLSRLNGKIKDITTSNVGTLTYQGSQADFGIRFDLKHLTGSENYTLFLGQFKVVRTVNQWQLFPVSSGTPIATIADQRLVTEWVGLFVKDKLLFYADGKLIFTYVNSSPINGTVQIQSGTGVTCEIDNILIMKKPVLSMAFLNASGQVLQNQVLNDTDLIVSGPVYDELGRPHVQPKPAKYSNSLFGIKTSYVTSFTGLTINGDVVSQNSQDGGYPYSRIQFDNSPLSRIIKSGLPGSDFQINRSERPQVILSEDVIHGIINGDDRKKFVLSSTYTSAENIYSTSIQDQFGRKVYDRIGPSKTSSISATVNSSNTEKTFFVTTSQTVSYSVSFGGGGFLDEGTLRKATFRIGTTPGGENIKKITYQVPGSYPSNVTGTFSAEPGVNYYLSYDNSYTTDGVKISVVGSVTYIGEEYKTTKYEYDSFGRLSKVYSPNYFNLPRPDANPNDFITTYTYDNRGRLIQTASTDEGFVKILQDKAGRVRFKLSKSGDKTGNDDIVYFRYDDLNRVVEEGVISSVDWSALPTHVENRYWPATPSTWRVKTEYDNIWNGSSYTPGKRGLMYRRLVNKDSDNSPDVEESYVYDSLNRLTSKKVKVTRYSSITYTTTYTYDFMSRLTRINYPGGHEVTYSYDHLNRIKSVGTPTDIDYYADYNYDPVTGRLLEEKLANGGSQKITTYSYNSPGWLSGISNPLFSENAFFTSGRFGDNGGYYDGKIAKLSYSYSFTSAPKNYDIRMKYDPYGQLITADYQATNGTDNTLNNGDFGVPANQQTVFDFHGNILNLTKNTNQFVSDFTGGNQLNEQYNQNTGEQTTLGYNLDGGVSAKTVFDGETTPVTMNFTYDYYSSRVLTGQKKIGSSTQYTVNLTYDSEGMRALKEVTAGSTTNYLLSLTTPGGTRLEERKRTNTGSETIKSYIYGVTGLIVIRSNAVDYFVIKDRINSTRIVFKGSDGTVVSRFDFSPYGEVIRSVESGDLVTLTYTGQEVDKDLGVMNYNARLYDPGLSRFLSADPLRQFHSPYNYVGNNPFSFIDPSGMGSEAPPTNLQPIGVDMKDFGVIEVPGGGGSGFGINYFAPYSASNGSGPMTSSAADATNAQIGRGFRTQSQIMEEQFDRAIYTHTVTSTQERWTVVQRASTNDQEITRFNAELITWEETYSNTIYTPEPRPDLAYGFISNYVQAVGGGLGWQAAVNQELVRNGEFMNRSNMVQSIRNINNKNVQRFISQTRNFSNWSTGITYAGTLLNLGSHAFTFVFDNQNFNTANIVDGGFSLLLGAATLAASAAATAGVAVIAGVSAPVVVGVLTVTGITYGTVRLVQGQDIDSWINRNWGYK